MASDNPRGLIPMRSLDGNPTGVTRRFSVSANNPAAIFKGDPVTFFNGHVRVIATSTPSAGEPGVLGVATAIYDSNARPLTHSLPSGGQFLDASTAGFIDVACNPDQTFLASTDATAAQSMIGQFTRVSAAGANSAAGVSGFLVKLADATTTNTTAHQFMIIGVGPNEEATGGIGNNAFANNQDVEVIISDHAFRRKVIIAGVATVKVGV